MSNASTTDHEGGDAPLLARARAGDIHAIGQLYGRYVDAARAVAAALVAPTDVDDLVAEAWARVSSRILAGGGPEDHLGAYLRATLRNLHRDQCRQPVHEQPASDHPWLLEAVAHDPSYATGAAPDDAPGEATPGALMDGQVAHAALARLPATWQRVLVMMELEQKDATTCGSALEVSPAAVAALAHRARCGIREAYLEVLVDQAGPVPTEACAWVRRRLAQDVRRALSEAHHARVTRHLGACDSCGVLDAELRDVHRMFDGPRPPRRGPGPTLPPPIAG